MCAQFLIKTSLKNIEYFFGIEIDSDLDSVDRKVVPYTPGPILIEHDGKLELREMQFSLVPGWSKEPKVKFATHNARIETIAEKPTWKGPLQNRRGLVPISGFIEPIYTGKLAGNMVQFHNTDGSLLYAAAIWDEWTDKKTGEVLESFSIITGEPPKFVKDVGHDRCPMFVTKDVVDMWMEPVKKDAATLVDLLLANRAKLDLETEIDRPLKAGWEKRIPKG